MKETLKMELKYWVDLITKAVHQKYKKDMDSIIGTLLDFDKKLDRTIEDLEDIRIIMQTQKRIREIEIDLDMRIETVENAYVLITKFEFPVPKEEIEKVENLEGTWLELQKKAMHVQIMLLTVQEHFQRELVNNLVLFEEECKKFVEDYNTKGVFHQSKPQTDYKCFKIILKPSGKSTHHTVLVKNSLDWSIQNNLSLMQ